MTNPYQKRVRKGKNHSSPAPSKREHIQGDKVQWALLVCSYMRKEVAGQKMCIRDSHSEHIRCPVHPTMTGIFEPFPATLQCRQWGLHRTGLYPIPPASA